MIDHVGLTVSDYERAKAFYRDALQLRPEEEEEDFASYRAGAVSVQLHPAGEPRPGVVLGRSGTGVPVQVTFEVADVDAAIDRLRRLGFKVFDEPKDRPWGKRDAGVLDPEGNEVYFSQSLD